MCKQRFIWSGIVSMFLIFIGAAGVYAATLFSDNFNRTGSGLGANWMIATGSYTTNGAQAISGSGSTSNWAKVTTSLGTNDYQVEAIITPPSGSAYSGLVARGDAATFYSTLYAAQIDAVGQKINLYRRNAGSWTLLQGVAAPGGILAGSPYKLKLEVSGSNPVALKVFFQDALLFSYTDASGSRVLSGSPGIENYNGGVAYDNFFVYSIDTTGNLPPSAKFSANPASGVAPLKVIFDASTSSDPDGSISAYAWDFGDGTTGPGQIVDHTYNNPGSYTATLTVTDNNNAQASVSQTISVQSSGGPTILFQDNFNRLGNTLGTNWRIDYGTFSTDGATAVSGNTIANWAAVTASLGTSDYAAESVIIVPAGSVYSGIAVRGNSKGIYTDNYSLQVSTAGTVNLYRRNASVWTLLKSVSAPGGIAAGTPYKIKLQVKGANPTQLEASFQGASLFTYNDSSAGQLFSGLPGLQNYNAGVKYDSFTIYALASNGNISPTAKLNCTPTAGPAPLTISCDGSASSDPDGSIVSYAWNFGDGTTGSGVTAGHTYSAAGSFPVTLVVTDSAGAQGTASVTITATGSTGGGPVGVGWNLATSVPGDLKGVYFVDQNTGWVVGLDMAIFKTTDGGNSWTKQTNILWNGSPPAILPWIFDVFFLDQNRGWVTGWPELILHTEDGGKTWVEQHRNPISPKDNQPFNSSNFCQDYDSDGNCVHVYGVYLRKIRFTPDGQTGFSVGRYRYIFKTTNGGQQWTLLPSNWKSPNWSPTPPCTDPDTGQPVTIHFNDYAPHLFSVDLLSANELFIVGGAAGTYNCQDWFNTIAHSADGGITWDFQVDLDQKQRFFDVKFIGDVGWVVGGGGSILRTTDRGKTWAVMNPTRSVTSTDLLGLAFPVLNQIWAVGENGVIVHTKDGGVSWEKQNSKTPLRLERVWFVDAFHGWAAAHLGAVPRTSSGGD